MTFLPPWQIFDWWALRRTELDFILEHDDGAQEHLAIDHRLRSLLVRPTATPTQTQLDLESRLTPREIQARIRSGQTMEEVATEAGISVERVERFAVPILHEREHIAQEAAKVSVRRDDHGAVMLLGELVGHRLEERGVPRDGMHWDAWRCDDRGWKVRLDYSAGGKERSAEWVYDSARRTMTPDDDEARWLLEEEPSAAVTPLRSVPVDATDAGSDAPAVDEAGTPEASEDTGVSSGTQEAIDTLLRGRETVPDAPPTKRKKKASVPSWDEILFGSRKPE